MITVQDIAAQRSGATTDARYASTHAVPLAQRFLHVVLFVTMLSSSFVFIQPSPYEGLIALLGLACLIAGITVSRKVVPLLLLLLIWNLSGLFALIPVLDKPDAYWFIAISFYLALSGLLFACLFAQGSIKQLSIMSTAYILSALLTTATGVIGYFNLFLGANDIFTMSGRVSATFKDPNVFGPFLILPLLMLIERSILVGIRLRDQVCIIVILFGLLLSGSRGAWGHFALSAVLMVWLMFITSPNRQSRVRIIAFSSAILIAGTALLLILMQIDAVADMLTQRAQLIQPYDAGNATGTRFGTQAISFEKILSHPNGLGPFELARQLGVASHNTYLGTMLQYGWIGGVTYLVLTLLTMALGFRAVLIKTPWQSYLIPAYATYIGLVFESFIIDTDHWRHYYLVLGIVWGLVSATSDYARSKRVSAPIEYTPDLIYNSPR